MKTGVTSSANMLCCINCGFVGAAKYSGHNGPYCDTCFDGHFKVSGVGVLDDGITNERPSFASVRLVSGETFHKCSYCGGWWGQGQGGESMDMKIVESEPPLEVRERVVCARCLIKAFDVILDPLFSAKWVGEFK